MKLEQNILNAKENWRRHAIKSAIGLLSILLFCQVAIFFISNYQFDNDNTKIALTNNDKEAVSEPTPSVEIPEEQLRQSYINSLNYFENKLKPELDKIDFPAWNNASEEQLDSLKDKALAEFTSSRYSKAKVAIDELNQLAQLTIADSRKEFDHALSSAQKAYDEDQYDEAKKRINQALMLDNTSVNATMLATKIDELPEILPQLEKIKAAYTEKNFDKELALIKSLLELVPERTAAINRKQVLINIINKRNFNTYIAQAYQALKQHDPQVVIQKISSAKKIFSNHQEIRDVTHALKKLEQTQQFSMYQKNAQLAIKSDDWLTTKIQLENALQQQPGDRESQKLLSIATSIVDLNNEFKQTISSPDRLSNKQFVSKVESKINKASLFKHRSPSLRKNTDKLSNLIKSMNKKIAVQVISDNQTYILVRGVGKVGKTQSKTIQLLPGKYTFEGKRKGFKSKLLAVRIPYDKTSFKLTILCDEPI